MKLTVLGKYGPYPKAKDGAASGYLVENDDDVIVLDMGSGTLSRLMSVVDLNKVTDIFISHFHFDHTSDLLPFRYLLEEREQKVNIYTHFDDSEWYKTLFTHPLFNIINVDESTNIKLKSTELSFLPMKHTVKDYAVIIKGDKIFCYTGDTMYNGNVDLCMQMSDTVLMDAGKPSGCTAPHMTVDDAKMLSTKYNKKIIVTHLSPDYDPTESFKDFPLIEVAREMKTYNI